MAKLSEMYSVGENFYYRVVRYDSKGWPEEEAARHTEAEALALVVDWFDPKKCAPIREEDVDLQDDGLEQLRVGGIKDPDEQTLIYVERIPSGQEEYETLDPAEVFEAVLTGPGAVAELVMTAIERTKVAA